jgi:hypothetical protein
MLLFPDTTPGTEAIAQRSKALMPQQGTAKARWAFERGRALACSGGQKTPHLLLTYYS